MTAPRHAGLVSLAAVSRVNYLLFHVLVLLAAEDIALTEVIAALESRHQKA